MRNKIFSMMLLLFIACISCTMAVKAGETANNPITANKTVKVNKTYKTYKTLKINKSSMANYTVTSSNSKVAAVKSNGNIKGLKKGNATVTLKSKKDNSTYATIKVKVKNNYSKSELRLMSAIIYSEANMECYAGKKAVGIVIMNRIKSSSFPNTLYNVIYQPYQFGPVRNGSLNRSLSLYDSGKMNSQCIKAAKASLNGDKVVSYNGKSINMSSYLYFSGYVSGARLSIQGHQFK